MIECLVATSAASKSSATHKPQTYSRDGRWHDRGRGANAGLRGNNHGEKWRADHDDATRRDHRRGGDNRQSFMTRAINHGSGGQLRQQCSHHYRRHGHANMRGLPMTIRNKINRQVRT